MYVSVCACVCQAHARGVRACVRVVVRVRVREYLCVHARERGCYAISSGSPSSRARLPLSCLQLALLLVELPQHVDVQVLNVAPQGVPARGEGHNKTFDG